MMSANSINNRKAEIIDATYTAIKERGITLPSYELISEKAGITRQLIRHYYPSSEDIAIDLCNTLAEAYKNCLVKGILLAGNKDRLPIFLDFYFNFLSEKDLPKPQDDEVYDAMFAFASTSEKVRKNLHDQYTLLQMTLAHEVQLTYPKLAQNKCRELGYLIVITMYGHWKMVATLGFNDEYNQVSRKALDHLIQSYVAKYC